MSGTHMNHMTLEVGPDREIVALDELPPPHTTRWGARRKAQVVAAVQAGLLTIDEACERYWLSLEEFTSWQRALSAEGVSGLKAGHLAHAASTEPKPWQRRAADHSGPTMVQPAAEPWRPTIVKPWEKPGR
jgi:hypothetical protein